MKIELIFLLLCTCLTKYLVQANEERQLGKKYSLSDLQDYPASLGYGDFPPAPYNLFPPPPPPPPPFLPPYPEKDAEFQDEVGELAIPEYSRKQVVVTARASPTCPTGFLLIGEDKCTRIDRLPVKRGCLDGWKYEQGKCIGAEVKAAERVCDDSFELAGDECVKTKHAPHQISCPDGFELTDTACEKKIYTNPEASCPIGYNMEHNVCTREEEVEAVLSCSGDFILKGNYCVEEAFEESQYSCKSPGFQLIGDMCYSNHQVPTERVCPEGFTSSHDACVKRSITSPNLVCFSGELKGSICVHEEKVAPLKRCNPTGFSLVASGDGKEECVHREIVPPRMLCSGGTHYNPKTGKCHYSKKEKYAEPIDVKHDCPAGYSWIPGEKCERIQRKRPELVCQDGSYVAEFTGECIAETRTSPEKSCNGGYHLSDDESVCEAHDLAGVQVGCPSGYTFNENKTGCIKTLKEVAVKECSPGYTRESENTCKKMQAVTPKEECPSGYRTRSKKKKGPPSCVGSFSKQIHYTCPAPFLQEENNDPSPGSKNGTPVCSTFERLLPSIDCPKNFVPDGGNPEKCQAKTIKAYHMACQDGYEFVGNQCLKKLVNPPIDDCPEGYTIKDDICIMQVYSPVTPSCPQDYAFDVLVGECYKIVESFDFMHRGIIPPGRAHGPQEALLSLDDSTTTTTTNEGLLNEEEQLQPLPPSNVQIVQQPVPIPSPVVYLPAQAPMMAPTPPMPMPIPVPYPVPAAPKTHAHTVSFKGKK